MDQFTPLQLSLQPFRLLMNLWCKVALKERWSTNEIKCELEQKRGGEDAVELLPKESHATASLIFKCAYPSFKLTFTNMICAPKSVELG